MDIIGKNITDSRNETGYGGFTIYGNAKDAKRLENSRGVKHQYLTCAIANLKVVGYEKETDRIESIIRNN